MKATRAIMTLAAAALVAAGLPSAAAAQEQAGAGLWEADHMADPTFCDFGFGADANGFCVADDPEGVELGVKFQTTQPVTVTGIRLYRADPEPLLATLWSPDGGERLAQVELPPADLPFENGWEDVTFPSAIPSTPGTTYIASYYTGSARYAYEHSFFSDSAYSAGPLVALQSVQGDGNGVFCYGGDSCYPDDTFRDSNYWVTPLWSYDFEGFGDGDPEWVQAKAGRAIPLTFSLGDDFGLGVLADGYPRMERIACSVGSDDPSEIAEAETAGASGLTFNADTQQYHYVWKTPKKAAGECYAFQLGLDDGSVHSMNVQFVR